MTRRSWLTVLIATGMAIVLLVIAAAAVTFRDEERRDYA